MVQLLSDPATGTTATMDANTTTSTETTTTTTTTNTTSHHALWSSPALSPAAQKQRTRRGYSVIETPRSSEFILPHHFHHNHHAHHHNHNHHHGHGHGHGHHHNPNSAVHTASSGQVSTQAAIPENAVLRTSPPTNNNNHPSTALPPTGGPGKKKPPRRSYSATDKEPEEVLPSIGLPQPSAHLGILDMPSELHYTLFDFLDPIDAVCLGLAHSKLYYIHRRKHAASVPLSTRYSGPNDMEWAWRGVSQPGSRSASPAPGAAATTSSSPSPSPSPSPPPKQQQLPLDKLRVKGQVYCRKCGISRCELHRHLKSWMGDGYEYCEIKQRFGAPAGTDAKNYCFMSSPKDRHRCGRHGGVKSASNATAIAA